MGKGEIMNNKTRSIKVEEDGDEISLPMPKTCIIYKCNKAKLIKNKKGFMVCSKCNCSYGKIK